MTQYVYRFPLHVIARLKRKRRDYNGVIRRRGFIVMGGRRLDCCSVQRYSVEAKCDLPTGRERARLSKSSVN
jgi:hypothetical protein